MLTGEKLTKGIYTDEELREFLLRNKDRGGFEFSHPAITKQWDTLLKKMLDFNINTRVSF